MSDDYVTTRETLNGVTVCMHRFIFTHAPAVMEETAHVWCSSLPRSASDVAEWFASLPAGAEVFDDDENPGSIEVRWERPATDDEIAEAEAKRRAEAEEAALWAEFKAWQAANR